MPATAADRRGRSGGVIEVGRPRCAAYDAGMAGYQPASRLPASAPAPPAPHRRRCATWSPRHGSRVSDLVAPLFVREGIDEPQPIASLPGVVQHTRESLRKEVAELADLGVGAVILFGVPATKDAIGSGAFDPDGHRAAGARRSASPRSATGWC